MLLLLMHLTTLFCDWFLFLTNILTFTFMALLLLLHLSRNFHPWLLFLVLFQNQNLGMKGRLNLNLIQPKIKIYSKLILMMKISTLVIWINFWMSFWRILLIVTTSFRYHIEPHFYSTLWLIVVYCDNILPLLHSLLLSTVLIHCSEFLYFFF